MKNHFLFVTLFMLAVGILAAVLALRSEDASGPGTPAPAERAPASPVKPDAPLRFDPTTFLNTHDPEVAAARALRPLRDALINDLLYPYQMALDDTWYRAGPVATELVDSLRYQCIKHPLTWWFTSGGYDKQALQQKIHQGLNMKERFAAARALSSQRASFRLLQRVEKENAALREALIRAGLAPDDLGDIPDREATWGQEEFAKYCAAYAAAGTKDNNLTMLPLLIGFIASPAFGPTNLVIGGRAISLSPGLMEVEAMTELEIQNHLVHTEANITAQVKASIAAAWPEVVRAYAQGMRRVVSDLDGKMLARQP